MLQRHMVKAHTDETEASGEATASSSDDGSEEEDADDRHVQPRKSTKAMDFSIGAITGSSYAAQAQHKLDNFKALRCPHPDLDQILQASMNTASVSQGTCEYVFRRTYDLRRHLLSAHDVEVDKTLVENWVSTAKASRKETY